MWRPGKLRQTIVRGHTMLKQSSFQHYFEEMQKLNHLVASGEREQADLQGFINLEIEEAADDPLLHSFLMGERSFYQKQYKAALKSYMEAKSMPLFQFFCYRTCAFLFDQEKKTEKALDFAQKALALHPDDWMTVALCSALLADTGRKEEASQMQQNLQSQRSPSRSPFPTSDEVSTSVSLGEEEFDELAQLFHDESETEQLPPTSTTSCESPPDREPYQVIQRHYDISSDEGLALERRIQRFQEERKRILKDYIIQAAHKVIPQDYLLHVFEGWHSTPHSAVTASMADLLQQQNQHTTGGYFLKWHGKGVAINPGRHFLSSLHQQGFHIGDVDCVIVTKSSPDSYTDVKALYELNTLFNHTQEPIHVIHYYLCQAAYQAIARILKPHFKPERNSVHCLELYLDSPELETIDLGNGIHLNYFPTSAQSISSTAKPDEAPQPSLGIRIDLTGPAQAPRSSSGNGHCIRLGYVAGTGWSPVLAEYLVGCDLLIVGIEDTGPDDYSKVKYNGSSLGFHGSLSLLEEVAPRLMLCCEFSGHEGDIRLELARKMRSDYAPHNTRGTTILPGDSGLSVDLTTLQARCAGSLAFVDPAQVHVIRTHDSFGPLQYLAPLNVL